MARIAELEKKPKAAKGALEFRVGKAASVSIT
jgi:hypothetical protein